MTYTYTFRDRLIEACAYKKITQRDLAGILGVSHTAIHNYASGRSLPSISVLFFLADALECPASWLLGERIDDKQNGEPKKAPWEVEK